MLRFRTQEQEPRTRVKIRPTISRERELELIVQAQAPEAEQQVRFAEWSTEKVREYFIGPMKLPNWAIVVGFLLGCWAIAGAVQHVPWFVAPPPHSLTVPEMEVFFATVLLIPFAILWNALDTRWRADWRKLADDLHVDPSTDAPPVNTPRSPREPIHGEMTVYMTLWQDGVSYGEDFGYLRFEGGALSFEGLRTDFSISKSRLRRIRTGLNLWTYFLGPYGLVKGNIFSYVADGVNYVIRFHRLGLEGDEIAESEYYKLADWTRDTAPESLVEILPPRSVAPGTRSRLLRSRAAAVLEAQLAVTVSICFAALSWFLLFVAGTGSHRSELGLWGVFLEAVFGLGAVWFWTLSAVGLKRAIRTFRFLKRNERQSSGSA